MHFFNFDVTARPLVGCRACQTDSDAWQRHAITHTHTHRTLSHPCDEYSVASNLLDVARCVLIDQPYLSISAMHASLASRFCRLKLLACSRAVWPPCAHESARDGHRMRGRGAHTRMHAQWQACRQTRARIDTRARMHTRSGLARTHVMLVCAPALRSISTIWGLPPLAAATKAVWPD